ncbi:indole-3-glycerol phosphate synthase TrpC [bacterium]|nr:indole-3-glycerol phosphate synthase TrpC [bacterium]
MPNILNRILRDVRRRLALRKAACPLAVMKRLAKTPLTRAPDFVRAIRGKRTLSVIAEVKRASPSSPRLAPGLDPINMAGTYQKSGAAALSVLTEEDHFSGHLSDLWTVAAAVPLPVLRKDFTIDEYQVYESKLCGAAAVLLIVRALPRPHLARLHRLALRLGLAALVEVHDERELETALAIGARVIGVNNRNLSTLKTDLAVARRILPLIPRDRVSVAESGYSRAKELSELEGHADAVLIGSAFLRNPGLVQDLVGRKGDREIGGCRTGQPRHSRESGNPVRPAIIWIPAFAGMTERAE